MVSSLDDDPLPHSLCASEPSRDELGRFCLTFSKAKVPHPPTPPSATKPPSGARKLKKLTSSGSAEWTTVTSAKKGQKRQPTNILTVRVSRSSMNNGHQQYEVIDPPTPPHLPPCVPTDTSLRPSSPMTRVLDPFEWKKSSSSIES
jgi:hypothetical protein